MPRLQTIYHEGAGRNPNTLQIGEAAIIAERLGIPVVSDFRTRDIAAGGQGAPLVPFVDYLLFASAKVNRVALNIGGIANITVLPRAAKVSQIIAFDTGPGNMVVDQLVERMTSGKQRFDRNGAIATTGRVNRPLLDSLLSDVYYKTKPPKTAGRERVRLRIRRPPSLLPESPIERPDRNGDCAHIHHYRLRRLHDSPRNNKNWVAAGGGTTTANLWPS